MFSRLSGPSVPCVDGITRLREDLAARLAAKLLEVQEATRDLDLLLQEAAASNLIRRPAPELTERERAVLGMLADGLTNREIADLLGISPHTVKDHCSSIYRRLGANNRASAVKRAGSLRPEVG